MKKVSLFLVLILCFAFAVSCADDTNNCSSDDVSLVVTSGRQSALDKNDAVSSSNASDENQSSDSETSSFISATGQGNSFTSSDISDSKPKPKPSVKDIKKSNKEKIRRIIEKRTTKDMTKLEKANAIYNWLFTNFGYRAAFVDTSKGISQNQTHELAAHYFRYYRGSCEHYAAVSKLIFEELGFECKYVFGSRYSNLSYKWGDHVWLVIKVNGSWYHVDGLFAGFFAKDMNDYFCVPDKKLKETHKWDKESVPKCSKQQVKK